MYIENDEYEPAWAIGLDDGYESELSEEDFQRFEDWQSCPPDDEQLSADWHDMQSLHGGYHDE